jgi:3' terminal RNA ribose 2'-O-methyltransferase Hen1
VFYPELSKVRSQAALLLDVDPVGLVRGRTDGPDSSLRQYVNDRPYAASLFLSVAMSRVLGTSMTGRSKERQELADTPVAWDAMITAVRCRGGSELLNRLFAPLGYAVEAKRYNLDDLFPEWGAGPYHTMRISRQIRLRDLLTHIYVLLPVLDADKHYWVGDDEVDKLLRKGEGWLSSHPERELIVSRSLKFDRKLSMAAMARLDSGISLLRTGCANSCHGRRKRRNCSESNTPQLERLRAHLCRMHLRRSNPQVTSVPMLNRRIGAVCERRAAAACSRMCVRGACA